MTTAVAQDRLASLEAKLDAVSHQVDYVVVALRQQETRRGMWDELRHDLAPVTADVMERVSRELDEVRGFIEPDDLLRVTKRLLRDLPCLEALLDQVESVSALGADLAPLSREMLLAAMAALAELEHRGYFAFARGAKEVMDRLVVSLGPEDLRALAASAPDAVQALKELAHPEVLGLLPALAQGLRATPAETPGLLRLLWRLHRPAARRGLARALEALEALGGPPAPTVEPDPTIR
ncbi:MAG: hypothetical protein ABIJ48_06890 [Actinomycetota bacterium]